MGKAPFRVYKFCGYWWVFKNFAPYSRFSFDTHDEAIAFLNKRWPWWP